MSSEAAQKAGGGAMSTRDELIADMTKSALSRSQSTGRALELHRELLEITSPPMADALIAEGWRKKPSKAEAMAYVERVLDDENHDDLCACVMWPESCVTYGKRRPWSYSHEGTVDAILALMDRGQ